MPPYRSNIVPGFVIADRFSPRRSRRESLLVIPLLIAMLNCEHFTLTDQFVVKPLLAAGEEAPDGCDQTIEFDGLVIELVAPRGHRLLALAGHGVCRQAN